MRTARRIGARVERRLAVRDEAGFTLIELINVLLILAILMSISVSAYSTLHARAEQKAAVANVSAILPAVSAWRTDNGTYVGMTMALLNAEYLNNTIDITYYDVGPTLDTTNYCVQYTSPSGDYVAKAQGPQGTMSVAPGNACT